MAIVPPFVPQQPDVLGGGKDVPEWFKNFLRQYNIFGIALSAGIRGGLDIGDNLVGIRSGYIKLTTGPKYTSGVFTPILLSWSSEISFKSTGPDEVRVGNCLPANNSVITSAVTIPTFSFNSNNNSISIPYITGLANSTTYNITFVAQ